MRSETIAGVLLGMFLTSPATALTVAVISDMNGSYGSVRYENRLSAAVEAIIDLKPDLVISTGDMVAGQRRPHLSEPEVRAMWKEFHAVVSTPLAEAGIPIAVTPGNHDASAYDGFEGERRIYAEEWRARRPKLAYADEADYPFFYAFDLDGVRFVSLDATTVGSLPAGPMSKLADALEGAGPMRVVFSHLPLWPVAIGRETEIIGDPALANLFGELGVDLHLSGHHHAFYPGASDDVAYVAQACLGAGPRALIGTGSRSKTGFVVLEMTSPSEPISVSFRAYPNFGETFDSTTLPPEIRSADAILNRLDLADLPDVRLETTE